MRTFSINIPQQTCQWHNAPQLPVSKRSKTLVSYSHTYSWYRKIRLSYIFPCFFGRRTIRTKKKRYFNKQTRTPWPHQPGRTPQRGSLLSPWGLGFVPLLEGKAGGAGKKPEVYLLVTQINPPFFVDLIYLNMKIWAWILYWDLLIIYLFYIYTLAFNYSKISVRIGKRKMSSSFTPDPRRMSGVQGGLGEHKRDILKLREALPSQRWALRHFQAWNLMKRPMIRRKWMAWQWRALLMKLTFRSPFLSFLKSTGERCSKISIFFSEHRSCSAFFKSQIWQSSCLHTVVLDNHMLHSYTACACAHILWTAPTRKHPTQHKSRVLRTMMLAVITSLYGIKFYPMRAQHQMLFKPADWIGVSTDVSYQYEHTVCIVYIILYYIIYISMTPWPCICVYLELWYLYVHATYRWRLLGLSDTQCDTGPAMPFARWRNSVTWRWESKMMWYHDSKVQNLSVSMFANHDVAKVTPRVGCFLSCMGWHFVK